MASTPESRIKGVIKGILDGHGAYRVMPVSNGMGAHGVPDFLVCIAGRFVGIEAKAGKGKPTALQMSNLRRILAAGGSALVINEHNVQHLDGWLSVIKMGSPALNNIDQFDQPTEPEGKDAPRKRTPQEKRT